MDAHLNAILEEIKGKIASDCANSNADFEEQTEEELHADGEAHDGGAVNKSDIPDSFDLYISDIIDMLQVEYDMGEEDALDAIQAAIDELAAAGSIPPVPDETDKAGTAMWLGKAKSSGLGGYVRKIAYDMMD